MAYTPSDIYRVIEPFNLTQGFGDNPAAYKKFGLAGHNGWDHRTKVTEDITLANGRVVKATPNGKRDLIATWFLNLYKIGFDPDGYGTYFEVLVQLYSTWKITYGHCTSVHSWQVRSEGDAMATSGSTGNSTGDHVHETVKRIKIVNGTHEVQNYNNGYFGAVNPQEFYNELRKWKIEKGTTPSPVPVEGGSMDMYQGFDLDNKPSMRVAVDSHLRVVKREVIPMNEVQQRLDDLSRQLVEERDRAVQQAFNEGVEAGKQMSPVPPQNENGEVKIDLSGLTENGVTTETTIGNTKIIRNYKLKQG